MYSQPPLCNTHNYTAHAGCHSPSFADMPSIAVQQWLAEASKWSSFIAWSRCEGLAESTRKDYLAAVRMYITAAEGRCLQNPEELIRYGYGRVNEGTWASHAAGKYITRLMAGMQWLNIPTPRIDASTKMSWLGKALQRLRVSRGTRHRKPLRPTQLERVPVCRSLRDTSKTLRPTAALIRIGYLGMLRTNELRKLSAKQMSWTRTRGSQALTVRIRISDKTHLARNRCIIVPVQEYWQPDAERLQKRASRNIALGMAEAALLSVREHKWAREALARERRTLGALRPGGNMFWIQAGLSTALRHKQGGWTPTSSVPAKHYTSATGVAVSAIMHQKANSTEQSHSR